tara:strand:+ start:357 stop:674 length:318 start_codon:yes stop_codon:yes gene_type:complete
MTKLQLTKEEHKFLGDFLDDGLHRELEIGEGQDFETYGDLKARKFLPKIIDKLGTKKKGESNYKESLTDILDYLDEVEAGCEDDDEISKQILKNIKNLRKLEREL